MRNLPLSEWERLGSTPCTLKFTRAMAIELELRLICASCDITSRPRYPPLEELPEQLEQSCLQSPYPCVGTFVSEKNCNKLLAPSNHLNDHVLYVRCWTPPPLKYIAFTMGSPSSMKRKVVESPATRTPIYRSMRTASLMRTKSQRWRWT